MSFVLLPKFSFWGDLSSHLYSTADFDRKCQNWPKVAMRT